jgi:hypothetical protein
MHYWTKDIIIDPSDATQSTWYVGVFSGWGGAPNGLGGLFKTTNRGSTWTKLTASQFDRVTSLTFNPALATQAFLTTETQGLWMSSNMNAATPTWTLVDSYPFRQPERVYFNPYNANQMWVSSFGNGMKVGLMNGPNALPDFEEAHANMNLFPNPFTDFFTIECTTDLMNETLTVVDMNGKIMKTLVVNKTSIILDTKHWPKGIYFVSCKNKTQKIVKK